MVVGFTSIYKTFVFSLKSVYVFSEFYVTVSILVFFFIPFLKDYIPEELKRLRKYKGKLLIKKAEKGYMRIYPPKGNKFIKVIKLKSS